jgi:hypothetical protein
MRRSQPIPPSADNPSVVPPPLSKPILRWHHQEVWYHKELV